MVLGRSTCDVSACLFCLFRRTNQRLDPRGPKFFRNGEGYPYPKVASVAPIDPSETIGNCPGSFSLLSPKPDRTTSSAPTQMAALERDCAELSERRAAAGATSQAGVAA
jgi:hypothetical protein